MRRGGNRLRRVALTAAFVLSIPAYAFALPILPLNSIHDTGIVEANYDLGEMIGWPSYVAQIADVYDDIPPADRATTAIVASNYGEAGAVDRYGGQFGLPHAFSGHNGYWYWGPPPDETKTVVAVGFDAEFLQESFGSVNLVSRLTNRYNLDNDEQGEDVFVCTDLTADWPTLWKRFKTIG
jgi:hypothetical protein